MDREVQSHGTFHGNCKTCHIYFRRVEDEARRKCTTMHSFGFFPLYTKDQNLSFTQYIHLELDILKTYPEAHIKLFFGYPCLTHKFLTAAVEWSTGISFLFFVLCLSHSIFTSLPFILPLTHNIPFNHALFKPLVFLEFFWCSIFLIRTYT